MKEIWKEIDIKENGLNKLYMISSLGRCKRKSGFITRKDGSSVFIKERILKNRIWGAGYYMTGLSNKGKTKLVTVHTLIARAFLKYKEGLNVDHIDRNKLNNSLGNLRYVTKQQNSFNYIYENKNKHSRYRGVSITKEKRWRAYITYNKKRHSLGEFIYEKDAALAYNKKAKEFFGEYAYLNILE